MGYAIVKGKYHKGPKKNKKRTRSSTVAKPTAARSRTDQVLEDNRDLIAALSGLNDADMATFVKSTAGPNPTGCTLVVHGGDRVSGGHGGLAYVAGLGGHGGTGASFPRGGRIVAVVPNEPTEPTRNKPREEIVGYIVKKPNGEMVLRFK